MREDLIRKEDAIIAVQQAYWMREDKGSEASYVADSIMCAAITNIKGVLPAQPEPLTDKEQRIFLAAMGREMKVCQEVDRNYTREPYEDSLVRVCREIERKVKGALWTT